MKIIDINQSDVKKISKDAVVLLPLGAVEVHGEHLPLGTDYFLATELCNRLEQRMGYNKAIILPPIPYGQVWSLGKVPGSIDIPDEILSRFIEYIALGVSQMGINKFAVINAHVGNCSAIKTASRAVSEKTDLKFYSFTYPGSDTVIKQVCTATMPHKGFFHACEIETSYMLYLCPDKVDMSKAICQYPDFPKEYDYISLRWSDFMDLAVLGDAKSATEEKGKKIIEAVLDKIEEIID